MKNNKLKKWSYILIILLFIIISATSLLFIIKPAIKGINSTNKIEVLSNSEINKLINVINDKYSVFYIELDNKYKIEYVNLDFKYVEEYKIIDSKYSAILENHEKKYNEIESSIKLEYDKLIKEVEDKYNLPMTDSRWFEYQKKASSEISILKGNMYDEIQEKTAGKSGEWSTIQKNKYNEIKLIDDSKKNEEIIIDSNKYNEKILLNKAKENEISKLNDNNLNKKKLLIKDIIRITFGILIMVMYILFILKKYNKLTKYKNKVKESWSGIDILLKRRFDLLPNFIDIVKGYTRYEEKAFKELILARSNYDASKTKNDEIKANKNITKEISKLIVLSENYPELKSNKNFIELQKELINTEDMIAKSREIYNINVLKYKNLSETFPTNLIAAMFGFEDEDYFDIEDEEKENIKV